jgi:hypothetical protein
MTIPKAAKMLNGRKKLPSPLILLRDPFVNLEAKFICRCGDRLQRILGSPGFAAFSCRMEHAHTNARALKPPWQPSEHQCNALRMRRLILLS